MQTHAHSEPLQMGKGEGSRNVSAGELLDTVDTSSRLLLVATTLPAVDTITAARYFVPLSRETRS